MHGKNTQRMIKTKLTNEPLCSSESLKGRIGMGNQLLTEIPGEEEKSLVAKELNYHIAGEQRERGGGSCFKPERRTALKPGMFLRITRQRMKSGGDRTFSRSKQKQISNPLLEGFH